MSGAEVICLGVGDGLASTGRHHAAFLYRLPGATLLVDCGEPVSRSLHATGLPADALDAILLSHLHFDHLGGFFMLLQGLKLEGRSRELAVHLPAWGLEPVRALVNAALLHDYRPSFPIRYHAWQAGAETRVAGAAVTPVRTTHMSRMESALPELPAGAFDCFAFGIEEGGRRVVHSSDLGAPGDLAPLLERPADLLVCELAHFAPAELYGFLLGQPVKSLALVHLSRALWARREEVLAEATAALPGVAVTVPADGAVLRL